MNGLDADDTRAMADCLRACGYTVADRVVAGGPPRPRGPLDARASGTTLRFLLPWLALHADAPFRFVGAPRLFERPLRPLLAALAPVGVHAAQDGASLVVHPAPTPDSLELTLDASLSSQFASACLLALATLPGGGLLRLQGLTSAPYLALTAELLARAGRPAQADGPTWRVPPGRLHGGTWEVPGDWSTAAALFAAGALVPGGVAVEGLPDDAQPDRALLRILADAGARVLPGPPPSVEGPVRRGLAADLSASPDLGPVLAALAALAPAPSVLTGLHTLRDKECDRVDASAELVRWLGGQVEVGADWLRITPGPDPGPRAPYSPRGDHRMAFAAAVGALARPGEILDPACVAKTWPGFWETWARVRARTRRP